MTIQRVDGVLGISVRGGAEHSLPLIVSRLIPGSPAALCKQIYIGDAVIASKLRSPVTSYNFPINFGIQIALLAKLAS